MPELLVAMLVLLVGIWVVAAKFPQLAEVMAGERIRDKMSRQADQWVERARDNVAGLPALIAPYNSDPAVGLGPYQVDDTVPGFHDPALPPDWSTPRGAGYSGNVVDDTLVVIGETFRVPAPSPDAPAPAQALYLLQLGPAEAVYRLYQPIPLTRDDTIAPTARNATLYPGTFCVQDDGVIRLSLPERDLQGNPFTPVVPSNAAEIEVSYAWLDSSDAPHEMLGELVPCTPDAGGVVNWTSGVVAGATPAPGPAGRVVPDSVSATFRYDYEVVPVGQAGASGAPPAYVDWNYGHALWFDAADQGQTMCVDYRLRRCPPSADPGDPEPGRRLQFAREVHHVPDDPTEGVYEVPLEYQMLDDQTPVFAVDLNGTPLAAAPLVIAFDVETGARYMDADGTLLFSYVTAGTPVPGAIEGRVCFPPGSPAAGRELLFHYRSLDRQTVQLQRAPRAFAEDIWTAQGTTRPFWALARWYLPSRDGVAYDPTSPTLYFPPCCLTQTVRVEYLGRAGRTVEVHTLPQQGVGNPPLGVLTLDDPVPGATPTATILSVTGVSVKGLATWFNRGKLRTASVETLLLDRLMPSLAEEPRPGALQP